MTEEQESQEQTEGEQDQTLSDLDIRTEDAEKVKGGAASDPCEGGQIHRR